MFYSIHSHDMLDRIEENMEIYLNNSINSIVIDTTLHKECSICLEKYNGIFTEPTLSLSVVINNLYNNIKKPCDCDSFVHNNCLDVWLSKSMSCFICRRKLVIIPVDNSYIEITNKQYRLACAIYFLQGIRAVGKITKTITKMLVYTYLSYHISKTIFVTITGFIYS